MNFKESLAKVFNVKLANKESEDIMTGLLQELILRIERLDNLISPMVRDYYNDRDNRASSISAKINAFENILKPAIEQLWVVKVDIEKLNKRNIKILDLIEEGLPAKTKEVKKKTPITNGSFFRVLEPKEANKTEPISPKRKYARKNVGLQNTPRSKSSAK